jgi:hypothetical protein
MRRREDVVQLSEGVIGRQRLLCVPKTQSARDDAAVDPVAIADEVVRSLIPRKCFRYLTCDPFGRGICCDVDPDEVFCGRAGR